MINNINGMLTNVRKLDIPSSTIAKVENVLRDLEHIKIEKDIKRRANKIVVVAVAVAAMLIITTTALAVTNSYGILDFFRTLINSGDVLPGATEIVQNDIPQYVDQSELVSFAIRDAVFDGSDIYIAFTVTPTQKDKLLLIALNYMPDDQITVLGSQFEGETNTIAEYAAAKGMGLIYVGIGGLEGGWSCQTESDGTLVIIFNTHYSGSITDKLDFELPCFLAPMPFSEGTMSNQPVTTLSFTLENTGHFSDTIGTGTVEFLDVGVRIDEIMLSASEVSVNVRIEYTVIDNEKFKTTDGGLWFEFLCDNYEDFPLGPEQRLPQGPGDGQITSLDASNTRFIQESSLAAMKDFPNHLIIRGFNAWDKTRYETHIVELS